MVEIQRGSSDVPYVNMLVYADSGAGKSVLAASGKKVLVVAPEDDGLLSPLRMGYDFDKIKVRKWQDLMAGYDHLYDNQDLLANYDFLDIDSITEMQGMCMRYVLDEQRQDRINKGQDPDTPQIQDYGKVYILLEKMVLAFNDLPINVIYTALPRLAEDPDGNEFLVPMLGSNKLKDYRYSMKIVSHMTSYGYLKVEVVEKPAPTAEDPNAKKKVKQRTIIWEDTGTIRAKDRTTRLAPKTILPAKHALQFLLDKINGVKTIQGTTSKTTIPASSGAHDYSEGPPVEKEIKEDASEPNELASVEA